MRAPDSGQRRSFLFLQGMASRFFGDLGDALRAQGYLVRRINFNGGDKAFWPLGGAVDFTGTLETWPEFLSRRLRQWNITDIILFGDCRPLHRLAIGVAARAGTPVHVFEEGYLRPNWITLEQGGVNAHSSLGSDPQWFVERARNLPPWDGGESVRNSMLRRSLEDIAYVVATKALGWRFRRYRSHRLWTPAQEYFGGARRFFGKSRARQRLERTLDMLAQEGRPYYAFPLQLETDSQIRFHSRFGGVRPAIECVVASFADAAPAEAVLIITEHPLDTSPFDWRQVVHDCAAAAGVEERVHFFPGGSPERMVRECRGLVTVNSTVGYLALNFGVPVIALGKAIYNMPDLTFQSNLKLFWREPLPPNAATFDAFRRVVASLTQINGSFFSKRGLTLAVRGAIDRLNATTDLQPVFTYAPGDRDDPCQSPAQISIASNV